jgi:octaprenyl-diphosphate synthase
LSIEKLFPALAPLLERVEEELHSHVGVMVDRAGAENGQNEYFDRVIRHIFLKPGKLLRPALVLLSARLARGRELDRLEPPTPRRLIQLGAVGELIHSASLVHDDVLDGEEVRRDQATLNRAYGNHVAVLVGDVLYAQAFALLNEMRLADRELHGRIIRMFCAAAQRMCLGEIASQRLLARGRRPGLEEYLAILEHKTAVLMAACCAGGALVGGAGEGAVRALEEFGLNFGMAFQLVDDHDDRDAMLDGQFDGLAMAERYMSRAHRRLAGLPAGEARESLEAVCRRVLQRARLAG